MARINYIDESQTSNPEILEAFDRMIKKRGKLTNIYKTLAHKPEILKTISKINRSAYCCHAHEQISSKMGFSRDEIEEMNDPVSANISDAEKAALIYAEALTVNPGSIPDSVYSNLEKYYSESQIVEITALAALYNMINRFNEALKLDPEEY